MKPGRVILAAALLMGLAAAGSRADDCPNPLNLTLSRTAPPHFDVDAELRITLTIDRQSEGAAIQSLGLTETVPAGWAFVSVEAGEGGVVPAIRPQAGATDRFEFAWIQPPAFPVSFAYTVRVPADFAPGAAEFSGTVLYRTDGPEMCSAPAGTTLTAAPGLARTLVIELLGDNPHETPENTVYIEPGFEVWTGLEFRREDLDESVTVDGAVNAGRPGDYTLTYGFPDAWLAENDFTNEPVTRLVTVTPAPCKGPFCCAAAPGVPGGRAGMGDLALMAAALLLLAIPRRRAFLGYNWSSARNTR